MLPAELSVSSENAWSVAIEKGRGLATGVLGYRAPSSRRGSAGVVASKKDEGYAPDHTASAALWRGTRSNSASRFRRGAGAQPESWKEGNLFQRLFRLNPAENIGSRDPIALTRE